MRGVTNRGRSDCVWHPDSLEDGYAAALYSDRTPLGCGKQTLSALRKCLDETNDTSLAEAIEWWDGSTDHGKHTLIQLPDCDGDGLIFDSTLHLKLCHPCDLPSPPPPLAAQYQRKFANLHSFRQQEPWTR